jgi:hypothetical protein
VVVTDNPHALAWRMVRGATVTRALGIAARLRIPDLLADGPRPAAELAAETGVDARALERLLRALASEGMFEEADGVVANNAASDLLREGEMWHDFAILFGEPWYVATDALDVAPDGETPFARRFGKDWASWLEGQPEYAAAFYRALEPEAREEADAVAERDWVGDETVVVGGSAAFLAGLLERHPGMRGTVLELPAFADLAEERLREAGVQDRAEVVRGTFLDDVPPADAYAFVGYLHDYRDDEAARMLANLRPSSPDAPILILDTVLPPGAGTHGGKWLDVMIRVVTGGVIRTEAEWRELAERAGLRVTEVGEGLVEARAS